MEGPSYATEDSIPTRGFPRCVRTFHIAHIYMSHQAAHLARLTANTITRWASTESDLHAHHPSTTVAADSATRPPEGGCAKGCDAPGGIGDCGHGRPGAPDLDDEVSERALRSAFLVADPSAACPCCAKRHRLEFQTACRLKHIHRLVRERVDSEWESHPDPEPGSELGPDIMARLREIHVGRAFAREIGDLEGNPLSPRMARAMMRGASVLSAIIAAHRLRNSQERHEGARRKGVPFVDRDPQSVRSLNAAELVFLVTSSLETLSELSGLALSKGTAIDAEDVGTIEDILLPDNDERRARLLWAFRECVEIGVLSHAMLRSGEWKHRMAAYKNCTARGTAHHPQQANRLSHRNRKHQAQAAESGVSADRGPTLDTRSPPLEEVLRSAGTSGCLSKLIPSRWHANVVARELYENPLLYRTHHGGLDPDARKRIICRAMSEASEVAVEREKVERGESAQRGSDGGGYSDDVEEDGGYRARHPSGRPERR